MKEPVRQQIVWIGVLVFVVLTFLSIPAMSSSLSPLMNNQLVVPEPDGTCELCWADPNAPTSDGSVTLTIYFEDDGQDFSGDFELELILHPDDPRRYVTIADVSMRHQETRRFAVESGTDWKWSEVSQIRVKAIPRQALPQR